MIPVRKYPHGGVHPPEAQADPSLAPDYRGDLPMYSGAVNMRPDLLFDMLGVGELAKLGFTASRAGYGALKNLMSRGASKSKDALSALAKQGVDPADLAELKKMDLSEEELLKMVKSTNKEAASKARKASEPALKAMREQMQGRKLQSVANRAIQNASKEESQALLNLQGKLDRALSQGILEEGKAVKIFQESVDKIFTQARIDDVILGKGDQLAKQLGPTLTELYKTDKALFDKIYYGDLLRPLTSTKLAGKVNPRMNEQGGRVPMPFKAVKSYA